MTFNMSAKTAILMFSRTATEQLDDLDIKGGPNLTPYTNLTQLHKILHIEELKEDYRHANCDLGLGHGFLDTALQMKATKEKTDILDTRMESVCE